MMPPPVSATPAPSTPQAEKKKFPPIKEKPAEKQTQVIVVQQPSRTNVNVNVDVWGMVSYWLRPRYQQQQQRIPIVERRFDQNQQDIIQPRSDQNQQDRIQRRIDQN